MPENIKTEIQEALQKLFDHWAPRLQQERFEAVGVNIQWRHGKEIQVNFVDLERDLAPAINPPTRVR